MTQINELTNKCGEFMDHIYLMSKSAEQTYALLAALCFNEKINTINFGHFFNICGLRHRLIAEKLMNFVEGHEQKINLSRIIRSFVHVPNVCDVIRMTPWILFEKALQIENIMLHKFKHLAKMAEEHNDSWALRACYMEIGHQISMVHKIRGHAKLIWERTLKNDNFEFPSIYDKTAIKDIVDQFNSDLQSNSLTAELVRSESEERFPCLFRSIHGPITEKRW